MATALLIIDIQNDYFPGGAMENSRTASARRSCWRTCAATIFPGS